MVSGWHCRDQYFAEHDEDRGHESGQVSHEVHLLGMSMRVTQHYGYPSRLHSSMKPQP